MKKEDKKNQRVKRKKNVLKPPRSSVNHLAEIHMPIPRQIPIIRQQIQTRTGTPRVPRSRFLELEPRLRTEIILVDDGGDGAEEALHVVDEGSYRVFYDVRDGVDEAAEELRVSLGGCGGCGFAGLHLLEHFFRCLSVVQTHYARVGGREGREGGEGGC